jgi:hypothetical protein
MDDLNLMDSAFVVTVLSAEGSFTGSPGAPAGWHP